MNFEQWSIGGKYLPHELTKILQESRARYRTRFLYNSSRQDSGEALSVNRQSEICLLEDFLTQGFTSLEMEFLRISRRVLEKRGMIYLWLKFAPYGRGYQLNASIKSIHDKDYLCRKPSAQDYSATKEEEAKTDFQS